MKFLSLINVKSFILITGTLVALLATLWIPGPAAAQGPETRGVTVLLVIDDSQSMRSADPDQRRGLGGRLLIERLFPEDQIGTVLFSRRARVARPITPVGDEENRDSLKNSFRLLQSTGATDMLDALSKAFSELEGHATGNPKLVIFLTDGQLIASNGDSPEYQAQWRELLRSYRAQGWPVFPVSFGRDVDTEFLKNIAEVTGGETCDAPSDSDLVSCFQRVLDTFKETERVLEIPPGCLAPGEVAKYPVAVDPYAGQFSVVLEQESPGPGVSLRASNGGLVGNPRQEGNFLLYNFSNPDPGVWEVRLTGPGCFAEAFAYIHSDVAIELESPAAVHAAQQPMDIRATVQGRRPQGDGSRDVLNGDLALSITSPKGDTSGVPMSASSQERTGHYPSTAALGDYRLDFQATVQFRDPHTGRQMQRTYQRQKRVEVVEAPALEVTLEGEETRRIPPGESFNIRGRISPDRIAGSPGLQATLESAEVDLDINPDGTFTGTVTPGRPGRHLLDLTYESTLTGLYGQVRYSTVSTAEVDVEFTPLDFQLSREDPDQKVIRGREVYLLGRFFSEGSPVEVDQRALTVQLETPLGETKEVDLHAGAGRGEYRGSFAPLESGRYALSGVNTDLSRNGVPFGIRADQVFEVLHKPVLEVDIKGLALGQVYPGAVVTRNLRVSNNSDRYISLVARTDSQDFSVDLTPALLPASSEMQSVQAQFRVDSTVAGGGGAPAGLFLDPGPGSEPEPGLVIPVTYEVGNFFVGLEKAEYDLGYIRPGDAEIPVRLELDYNTPAPVTLAATVPSASSPAPLEIPLPEGRGRETATFTLPLSRSLAPGAYQDIVTLSTNPPIPVRPPGEVRVSYRMPSSPEAWVLDNRWWTLSAVGVSALFGLLVWGGILSRKVILQGRLLIYDRWRLTRARREDLRRFGRPEVTIGCQADVSLTDPSGVIDGQHAFIAATRDAPYPRVYPVGVARVIGPFGEEVDGTGAPLGSGDTFSVGHYNLEWSPTWAGSRIGRVLGNPWWKLGLGLALAVVAGVAVAFYLVLL